MRRMTYGTGVIQGLALVMAESGVDHERVRENECLVEIISSNLRTGGCKDDLYQQSPLQM